MNDPFGPFEFDEQEMFGKLTDEINGKPRNEKEVDVQIDANDDKAVASENETHANYGVEPMRKVSSCNCLQNTKLVGQPEIKDMLSEDKF